MQNRKIGRLSLLLGVILLLMGSFWLFGWEDEYDQRFTGKTLRFDYYHSGTSSQEIFSVDEVRLEGDWPGSRTRLLDTLNLGKYLFEVIDPATNQVIYSRGFASIFGEWETTGEARQGIYRTFHESQRFPEPRMAVQLVLKKRDSQGDFREVFATRIDPGSRFVNRSPVQSGDQVVKVLENGPASSKVDLLVLGDGYQSDESDKFHADVERLVAALFQTDPFKARKADFNVWAMATPSQDSGIKDPRRNLWKNTTLGLTFNAFDLDRYVLTFENRRLRELAAQAPYDALMLLYNGRKYGGGGIFNLWATCSSDSSVAPYVFVHEMGHSFAGLGDEYYTSQVAYENFNPAGVEPWEPNVTALLDPANLKWRDLVEEGTPLPTPWNQEAYDQASLSYQERRIQLRNSGGNDDAVEQLFDDVKQTTSSMLAQEKYAGKIGAFEGASYQAHGLYRPSADCIMFTRNPTNFCKVCEKAISRVIDLYSKP